MIPLANSTLQATTEGAILTTCKALGAWWDGKRQGESISIWERYRPLEKVIAYSCLQTPLVCLVGLHKWK